MFNEVQYELAKIIFLNVFLSSTILFLIAELVSLVFSMPWWYALAAAGVYFIITFVTEIRKITIAHVEQKNPEMREILRTAKDNMNEDTIMAHALFYEVLERMKRVSSGTFLEFKKLMVKISVIFVLAIVLVSLAFFNVNVARFDNPFERPLGALGAFLGRITGNPGGGTGTGNDSDIFGDPSMAKLGNDQLVATVNPSLDAPDFNNVDPAAPSADPLADLGGQQAGFNTPGSGGTGSGLSEKELERVDKYWASTQEEKP
jgi:hypothetical protein